MTNRRRTRKLTCQNLLDLEVESLETRQLLATFTVTNVGDGEVANAGDQPGTLRQAIFDANSNAGADTIEFDLTGGVGLIQLDEGPLEITDELTINGLGEDQLLIRASHEDSIFRVDRAAVQINGLSLLDGFSDSNGGAIAAMGGSLNLQDVTISGSSAAGLGGAIFGSGGTPIVLVNTTLVGNEAARGGAVNAGNLTIEQSRILNNSANINGGGVAHSRENGFMLLADTTVSGNSAQLGGGVSTTGDAEIVRSTFSDNQAQNAGGVRVGGRGTTVSISQSNISGNQADERGAGIGLQPVAGGAVTIADSIISNNVIDNPGDGTLEGAGVFIITRNSQIEIRDSVVSGNVIEPDGSFTDRHGGGIRFTTQDAFNEQGSTLNLLRTEMYRNSAAFGGGVSAYLRERDVLAFDSSELHHNRAVRGGAISVISNAGSLRVDSTALSGNSATYGGGLWGLMNNASSVDISDASFAANTADSGGGAELILSDSTAVVQDSAFVGNQARPGTGGGLSVAGGRNSQVAVQQSTFAGNTAQDGGGLHIYTSGEAGIYSSQVRDNVSLSSGGGIGLSGQGDFLIDQSTVADNQALEINGGGIEADLLNASLLINESTISGNRGSNGGGIHVEHDGSYVRVLSSTISGNSASWNGGGIDSRAVATGYIKVAHSTVYGNTARRQGGGTRTRGPYLTVEHSIIAGNLSDSTQPRDMDDEGFVIVSNSLIGVRPSNINFSSNNLFGSAADPLDPQLAPLADNGGPTLTHALAEDSPAIDAGNTSTIVPPEFDQRGDGFARIVGDRIDIGAFESGSSGGFVIVDRRTDDSFEHDGDGAIVGRNSLDSDNRNPTGIASANSRTWVVDRNDNVYVYDDEGSLLGTWEADDVRSPEGITTNGTDIWIVDRSRDRVYFYANGAQLLTGEVSATSSFALDSDNRNPMGISYGVIDGEPRLWVVDDRGASETVFRYHIDGTLEGSWEFDVGTNTRPRGIAVNANAPSDVLIVDGALDQVIVFDEAATATTGTEEVDSTIALDPTATDPQGLAVPSNFASAASRSAASHSSSSPQVAELDGLRLRFAPQEGLVNRISLRPALGLADLLGGDEDEQQM